MLLNCPWLLLVLIICCCYYILIAYFDVYRPPGCTVRNWSLQTFWSCFLPTILGVGTTFIISDGCCSNVLIIFFHCLFSLFNTLFLSIDYRFCSNLFFNRISSHLLLMKSMDCVFFSCLRIFSSLLFVIELYIWGLFVARMSPYQMLRNCCWSVEMCRWCFIFGLSIDFAISVKICEL